MTNNPQALTYGIDNYDDLLAQIEPFIPELQEIYFAGGEPLMMEEHYRLLDLLDKHKKYDVYLRYNTNFSIFDFQGRNVFELWNKFEKVMVGASLDDAHQRGELQRKGQVWAEVVENRKKMMTICPHVQFMLSVTVNVFNVLHYPKFHREWTEQGLIDIADCWPNVLQQPEYYNIRILPPTLKKQAAKILQAHSEWIQTMPTKDPFRRDLALKELKHCISYMNAEDWTHLLPDFRKKCAELDQLRGEITKAVFPELGLLF